jgi:hypothetical protein
VACYLHAKEIYTLALGANHPRGCFAMEGLSATYEQQGQLAKARLMILDVVRIRRVALGREHKLYLKSKDDLERLTALAPAVDLGGANRTTSYRQRSPATSLTRHLTASPGFSEGSRQSRHSRGERHFATTQ